MCRSQYQRLDIISLANTRHPKQIEGLPAWTRDWSQPSDDAGNRLILSGVWSDIVQDSFADVESNLLYDTRGPGSSDFRFEGNALHCSVVVWDEVRSVSAHIPPSARISGYPDFFSVLAHDVLPQFLERIISDIDDTQEVPQAAAGAVQDFLDACILGLHFDGARRLRDISEVFAASDERGIWIDEDVSSGAGPWRAHIAAVMSGRRLALTSQEMIGLVPQNALPQRDAVAVVKGCSVPVLIRRRDAGHGFAIVGERYFSRIMDGQVAEMASREGIWTELPIL